MDISLLLILLLALGIIVSGILLLKQSARKFDLTDEQLADIKKRNKTLDEEENERDGN